MQYRFEGELTTRDCKRHIVHRFTVPGGGAKAWLDGARLELHLHYAPNRAQGFTNLLTLTLFDPNGFRGAGHREGPAHRVCLGLDEATPGYLPGPLPAGEWIAQIDTHMIMPGEALHYWLEVAVTDAPPVSPQDACVHTGGSLERLRRGPGWYRGDLHSHTDHSDADGFTVAELLRSAREAGLDFVFLTDHNTTSGLAEMDASTSEDLLCAGGVELTTFWGHALCLGTRTWVDWRVRPGDGAMARIADAVYASGGVYIISHPQAGGDPGCTGCAWRFGEMMPGRARLVEIWNGPWLCDSNNEQALALWYDWLNQGHRLVATAGTDTHWARDYAARPGFDVIYAGELSEAELLKGLLLGHLYLTAGPQLTFQAKDDRGQTWIMGDTIARPAEFTVTWDHCPADARLRLIANGRLLREWVAGPQGDHTWSMTPHDAHWLLAEIRRADGALLAITNPIYLQQGPAR